MENEEKKETTGEESKPAGEASIEASEEASKKKWDAKECKAKMCAMWGKNKKTILAVIALLVVVGASFGYTKFLKKTDIGLAGAKAKVEDFIKNNAPNGGQGVTVKEVAKDKASGLYQVTIEANKQDIVTYITPDGSKLFLQTVDLNDQKPTAEAQKQAAQKEIPKNDKPSVDLYVMSFCPYGNKAEDTLKPAYDLLKNKVNFNFHYIVSTEGDKVQSLHGEKEVVENEKEACVLKNYGKDKWLAMVTYVNEKCGSDGSCFEAGAKSLGINVASINSCVDSQGLALMQQNEKDSTAAKAQGSPTMLINGVTSDSVYQYDNSEAYKQAICSAFNTAPKECQTKLAEKAAAGSATPAGSCSTPQN